MLRSSFLLTVASVGLLIAVAIGNAQAAGRGGSGGGGGGVGMVAGDVLDTRRFPVIDIAKGGSIQGEIAALQKLIETAIPSVPIVSRDAGTLIIPGHGRICDQLDVVEYRDMVTIIRDRIHDLMKQGLTLEQIKAASPARGYTRRYGSDPSWTTNDFVDAVYRSLSKKVQ